MWNLCAIHINNPYNWQIKLLLKMFKEMCGIKPEFDK
jgi:hypothetical protein